VRILHQFRLIHDVLLDRTAPQERFKIPKGENTRIGKTDQRLEICNSNGVFV